MMSPVHVIYFLSTLCFFVAHSINLHFDAPRLNNEQCPGIYPHVFSSSVPLGELKLNFVKVDTVNSPEDCVSSCCSDPSCNEAFLYEKNNTLACYKVTCKEVENCLPKADEKGNSTHVVLVRSGLSQNWETLLAQHQVLLPKKSTTCEVGLDLATCHENEVCTPVNAKSRNGKCQCKEGYTYDSNGQCTKAYINVPSSATTVASTKTPEPTRITVEISSKNITLPKNSASLTAFAIPEASNGEKYEYEWVLISNQTSGVMENGNNPTLTVKNLIQGTYRFKVVVRGKSVIGDAFGNITVFPEKRVNKPPKAIVRPTNQKIYLPINSAIIDGSESWDDVPSKLVFKWEKEIAPVQYPSLSSSEQTLELKNLILGNYSIRLTVTDSDGVSDSTNSTLLVLPQKDYPPTANAGEDIIIYLPQDNVILNGNRSTDDHGIVSWEWKRAPSDTDLAADIQDVRTPYPKISNLVKGVYTFVLKVSDVKNQVSEGTVTVYVRDPINVPPKANAGEDKQLSLPVNWITLDGSLSKDDINISSYSWTQESGPSDSKIINASAQVTNVTNLTKGVYIYKLVVIDNSKNKGEDTVKITVNQDTNSSPVANAGEDMTVNLPLSVIAVNGSKSTDDFRIAKWEWIRDENSLAAGKIIGNSTFESVLYLTDVVTGEYIFRLKVTDDQGKTSEDSISIIVQDNPHKKEILQLILNENLDALTSSLLDRILERIKLSIVRGDDTTMKIELISLFPQLDSNFVVMHFLMKKQDKKGKEIILKGVDVLKTLQTKLRTDPDILELKVINLDTLVCQNNCSGHGKCHQATRTCICQPFWIENFVRRQLMDGKSNCEWSIIYVGIFLSILTTIITCGLVFIMCKNKKIPGKLTMKRRYTKLGQHDQDMELRSPYTSSLMESETDSDEEILFENAANGSVLGNGGTLTNRNVSAHT
uniref:Dyslexiaassociated protein KIAA0319like proteinlike [Bombus impatiens] n=1 Tax=Lepeophtheirus salmonis TaxID=72036 RepID=A0A0K2TVX1_LEPSM